MYFKRFSIVLASSALLLWMVLWTQKAFAATTSCGPCRKASNRGFTCDFVGSEEFARSDDTPCSSPTSNAGASANSDTSNASNSASNTGGGSAGASNKKTAGDAKKPPRISIGKAEVESAKSKAGKTKKFMNMTALANGAAAAYLFRKYKKCSGSCTHYKVMGILAAAQAGLTFLSAKKMRDVENKLSGGMPIVPPPADPSSCAPGSEGCPAAKPPVPETVPCLNSSRTNCRISFPTDSAPVITDPNTGQNIDISGLIGAVDQNDPKIRQVLDEIKEQTQDMFPADYEWERDLPPSASAGGKGGASSSSGSGSVAGGALGASLGALEDAEQQDSEWVEESGSGGGLSNVFATGKGGASAAAGGAAGGARIRGLSSESAEDEMDRFLSKLGLKKKKKKAAAGAAVKPLPFGKDKIAPASGNIFQAAHQRYMDFLHRGEFMQNR